MNASKLFFIALTALFMASLAFAQGSQEERVTISTYYPAPYGEYEALSVDDAATTAAGEVYATATAGCMVIERRLGIGIIEPQAPLHVNGPIMLEPTDAASYAGAKRNGMMICDSGDGDKIKRWDSTIGDWVVLGGDKKTVIGAISKTIYNVASPHYQVFDTGLSKVDAAQAWGFCRYANQSKTGLTECFTQINRNLNNDSPGYITVEIHTVGFKGEDVEEHIFYVATGDPKS